MKRTLITTTFIAFAWLHTSTAMAGSGCSIRDVVGKWVFATDVGRLGFPGLPADTEITAIGTMNIERDGSLYGAFDVTLEGLEFRPGETYAGSIHVNRDCTGTLSFVDSAGNARTDSILVVSRREMLGMSQNPYVLWTYQMRRIWRGRDN